MTRRSSKVLNLSSSSFIVNPLVSYLVTIIIAAVRVVLDLFYTRYRRDDDDNILTFIKLISTWIFQIAYVSLNCPFHTVLYILCYYVTRRGSCRVGKIVFTSWDYSFRKILYFLISTTLTHYNIWFLRGFCKKYTHKQNDAHHNKILLWLSNVYK